MQNAKLKGASADYNSKPAVVNAFMRSKTKRKRL